MNAYLLAVTLQNKVLFEKPAAQRKHGDVRKKRIEHKKLLVRAASNR